MTLKETSYIVEKATEFDKSGNVIFCSDEDVNRHMRKHFVKYPHLFVLCCLMDKQIDADRAWGIPFTICEAFGTHDIYELDRISEMEYQAFFNENRLHRFNDQMATVFKAAIDRIICVYNGDASNIWVGNPSSATVVTRFLEFEGCGIKIATMATNLLHRALSVQYSDYYSVDISPDVHIMRVMNRLGLISDELKDDRTLAIYRAREINPQYPGILDGFFWDIGRNHCHPSDPSCLECKINTVCKYYGKV